MAGWGFSAAEIVAFSSVLPTALSRHLVGCSLPPGASSECGGSSNGTQLSAQAQRKNLCIPGPLACGLGRLQLQWKCVETEKGKLWFGLSRPNAEREREGLSANPQLQGPCPPASTATAQKPVWKQANFPAETVPLTHFKTGLWESKNKDTVSSALDYGRIGNTKPHAIFRKQVFMLKGFPGGTSGKEPACQCRRCKRRGFDRWSGKLPWRRAWQPTPVFLPGESHGQRSLEGHRVKHDGSDLARIHAEMQVSSIFHVGPPDGVVLSLLMCWDNSNHSLWPTPETSDILGRVHVPIPTWQINEAENSWLRDWPWILKLTGNRAVIQNQAWARNPAALSTISGAIGQSSLNPLNLTLCWAHRTSLVVHQFWVHLPVQGTWIRSLVWEDPTCNGAYKPMCHSYWAHVLQALKPAHPEPVLCNKRSHSKEKPMHHNQRVGPALATRESPCATLKTQNSPKKA